MSSSAPTPPGPVLGPCQSWITGADVAACCNANVGSDAALLDMVALESGMALFEISGRQFTGLCERKVRPSRDVCGCFGQSESLGFGPWYWSWGGASGGGWRNECGDVLGCGPLSRWRLAGYPVRQIEEVKVDGQVIPEFIDGVRQWRLDGWMWLVRMADPGPPVVEQFWPSCQNLALDDDQPSTASVTYLHGVDPPPIAFDAAAQLACQLYLSCKGQKCQLPVGATKSTRQGITVERGLLANWFDPKKSTGLPMLDTFLRAYWMGEGSRKPAVFSPDVQAYAQRVGNDPVGL